MEIEQLFYVLGVVYFGVWSVAGVAVIAFSIMAFREYTQFKAFVKENSTALVAGLGLLQGMPLKRLMPLAAVVPVLKGIVGSIRKRKQ